MKDTGRLYLRKATPDDRDILFEWRNEKLCRENSLNTDEVPYETHCDWFERRLKDEDTLLYIAVLVKTGEEFTEQDRAAESMQTEYRAGQVRVDVEGTLGKISYAVAAEYRGQGLGTQMLAAVEQEPEVLAKVGKLEAEVKQSNPVSGRCFEKLGYKKEQKEDIYFYSKALKEHP